MILEFLSKISDTIGIVGVVLLLSMYFLLSTNKLSSHQLRYQIFNFLGASLILFSLVFHFNLASVVIEVSWMLISMIGMYRILTSNKNDTIQASNIVRLSDFNNRQKNNTPPEVTIH